MRVLDVPRRGQNISGGIDITMVNAFACRAFPVPRSQGEIILDIAAAATAFGGGFKSVDDHQPLAVPLGLIGQLTPELIETGIQYGFTTHHAPRHALDVQILNGDQVVITNNPPGDLMEEIHPGIADAAVQSGDFQALAFPPA